MTPGSAAALSEGNCWNRITGSYVVSGYYYCSSEPEQSGTWAADRTAGGQVSIMLSPSRGSAWSILACCDSNTIR